MSDGNSLNAFLLRIKPQPRANFVRQTKRLKKTYGSSIREDIFGKKYVQ